MRVSYIEIYNEELNDLLRPENSNLRVFEDAVMGAYVKDLTEVAVCTAEDAMKLLARGNEYRHVSATAMNAKSSRSHTLFRMAVETRACDAAASDVLDIDTNIDTMSECKTEDLTPSRAQKRGVCVRVCVCVYVCVYLEYRYSV